MLWDKLALLDVRHRAVVREYIEWGRQRQQRHPLGYQNCESPLGQELVGSVVGEDACACHHTRADAVPAADPELGGGAPARTDRVM